MCFLEPGIDLVAVVRLSFLRHELSLVCRLDCRHILQFGCGTVVSSPWQVDQSESMWHSHITRDKVFAVDGLDLLWVVWQQVLLLLGSVVSCVHIQQSVRVPRFLS